MNPLQFFTVNPSFEYMHFDYFESYGHYLANCGQVKSVKVTSAYALLTFTERMTKIRIPMPIEANIFLETMIPFVPLL